MSNVDGEGPWDAQLRIWMDMVEVDMMTPQYIPVLHELVQVYTSFERLIGSDDSGAILGVLERYNDLVAAARDRRK